MPLQSMQGEADDLSPWLIFDADNTLWDIESLYNDARNAFCCYVGELLLKRSPGATLDAGLIDGLQRHRDIQLQKTHGYSAARFARSFEDTLSFLLPFSSPGEVQHVRNLAMNVFEREADTCDGLHAAIDALRRDYSLGIITAGERWVQERRLAAFRFRDQFQKIVIVEHKSQQIFEDFCLAEKVDKSRSWVIGDSLRSDILPAIGAGLRAIHFEAPNWAYEHTEKPDGIASVQTMQEVVALVCTEPVVR